MDWITFTFAPMYAYGKQEQYTQALADGLREMCGMKLWVDVFDGEWNSHAKGRAPYTDSWKNGDGGITLFASPTLSHACIEVSGAGCEKLISSGNMEQLLKACAGRVTRIDIATDIETGVHPGEFVEQVRHDRMRASGYQKSETGETCYVGSQKSDRYARVYRYNPPHPRSHLLRVEHVFRREYAKNVARTCVESGVSAVSVAAGIAFGWSHAIWLPESDNDADITTTAHTQKGGNTVFWLVNSCAPAFKRLVRSGEIKDAAKFFEAYFVEA